MKNTRPAIAAVIAVSAALLFTGARPAAARATHDRRCRLGLLEAALRCARHQQRRAEHAPATAPADADAQTASASALADFSDQAKKLDDSYSDNKDVTSLWMTSRRKIDAGQD